MLRDVEKQHCRALREFKGAASHCPSKTKEDNTLKFQYFVANKRFME